uniref:MLO-like protein 1 n=1 Tax=Chenopodium quinoa TaxID=63459 RepID=A0A803MQW7_CHEQI
MAGGGGGLPYESTPSWVIGIVVLVIVGISWVIDNILCYLGKAKLILLGFVSLLLAVFQDDIANKCISDHLTEKWIPCRDDKSTSKATSHLQISNGGRHLLAAEDISSCPSGKVSFVSIGVLHELHILIFILAIVHVACCTLTVLLGEVKISFFKHLAGILTKADYAAMRLGFTLLVPLDIRRYFLYTQCGRVVIQTICSYSTLPLYAIVTQMRNSYNKEAMKRLSIESSNRVTEGSSPERSDTIVSVEMENQLEGQGSIQTVEETE